MVSVSTQTASRKKTGTEAGTARFPAGCLEFLAELRQNNNRDWFQQQKQKFEDLLHTPLMRFAELLNAMFVKNAPAYAFPQASKALNRIYRDIRFSADKTPSKTNVSVLFPHQRLGKKAGAAFYFSLSATEVMIAAGMYFGETSELQAVREHLAEHHAGFRAILASKALKQTFGELSGESLRKVPRQFGEEHPAADLLRKKQWLLAATWPAKTALDADFAARTLKAFQLLIPFVDFLNAPLETTRASRSI